MRRALLALLAAALCGCSATARSSREYARGHQAHGRAGTPRLNRNGRDAAALYAEAERHYRAAAELGSLDAMRQLVFFYDPWNAIYVVRKDPAEAMKWQLRVAERGDPADMAYLASSYERGWAVPRDLDKAREWLLRAVKAETDPAERAKLQVKLENLGQRRGKEPTAGAWEAERRRFEARARRGDRVAQRRMAWEHYWAGDDAGFIAGLRVLAEQGHQESWCDLGNQLILGIGGGWEPIEAYQWLSLCHSSSGIHARMLDGLKFTLTREELAEGDRRVAAFKEAKAR